ncbi:DUF3099 domain-containing protein [Nocardioides sp. zg-ZUI104]|uniref:DUF3099 domain-containing protein n=1 Tax=Nocardioides faecalis TaxID=2803858 RepID=UPI001BCEE070|nr:DUF3099 domain-containing protein [Nocardioides faecalis]MBS4753907.1 DUF3099 domain-containing protein [Nocardioides faecalis]
MSSPRSARTSRPVDGDVVRITTAGTSRAEDMSKRQRNYAIAMSIRTVCFIGAAVTGAAGLTWVWPWLIAGAVFLPYVAVVLANAGDSRASSLPLPGGGDPQRQLGSTPREL